MLGAIGSKSFDDVIIFEVSSEYVYTLDEFSRQNSVRYAKHDILLKKPISQYTGQELDKISFKIELKSSFGIKPRDEMDKLIKLQRDGEVLTLVIGNKPFGVFRWVIKDLNMTWKQIDNKGLLTSSTVELSLEEYI